MRWITFIIVIVFAILPSAHAMTVEQVETKSGIKAWLVTSATIPVVSIHVAFKGGASYDGAGLEGRSVILSSLMTKGAGELDEVAYQQAIEDRAISIGFQSGRDSLYGVVRSLSEHKEQAFYYLSLALKSPRLDAVNIERFKAQLIASIQREAESPNAQAGKIMRQIAYGDHAYGHSTKGTEQSVTAMSREDLLRYHQDYIARDNMIISVVGDITADELESLLDRYLSDMPIESKVTTLQDKGIDVKPEIYWQNYQAPQSVIAFVSQGIKRTDPDWYKAYVLNYIVGGGGLTSILAEEVREKRGLAYSVNTSLNPQHYGASLTGSLGTANDKVVQAIELIKSELKRIAKEGVSEAQLKDAKTYLTGSYPLRFSTSGSIAGQMTGAQLLGFDRGYFDRRNEYIQAVSLEDIRQMAARLLRTDEMAWIIVGQAEGLEGLKMPINKINEAQNAD